MSVPANVENLVKRFADNISDYKRGKYNETQVRREFIDPLFEAIGWDVNNTKGYAEAYKEVVHEDAIKVGRATKAPDYSFRIGGTRKFFLEAKKPSVDIKQDTHPAYQLRRYAWSAKLPLSILTDFEEFAVYDCGIQPTKTDKAAAARIMYLTYDQYLDRWQELVDIFSPEAIRKGSFDKYAQTNKQKRGTAEVDAAFLAEIERWRESLARNIALRNALSQRELNFAVQMTIDRLIFLRIAEDRGIEPYGQLQGLLKLGNVYPQLLTIFQQADDRYNSGLFHFKAEKGRDAPDLVTPNLAIDDRVFQDIFKNLYYPDSPYEFSVLSADILGQVYEQFLGKVIRLTDGGRAKVEEKPEVRKAGGVYYTPTYIVDYIVKNTVGQLVEGKSPKQLGGKIPLRVLDPACGSGSFLLGAYQFLLDWNLNWYIANNPDQWASRRNAPIYNAPTVDPTAPNWKLTSAERKRILTNHIFGVDIDPQAVEVTKLSLLLKVLEGEDQQSLARQLTFAGYGERVLPDLNHNIKCGNSLIGPDYYDGQQMGLGLFDEAEFYRVNAFDWQAEFKEIMQAGGFDAVIGNPPYIRIQAMKEWAAKEVNFFGQKYSTASKGNYDIYVIFVEKCLKLLNKNGLLGYILPNKFFSTDYGYMLRKIISERQALSRVVDFGHGQVFEATTYTCLLFLTSSASHEFEYAKVEPPTDLVYQKLDFRTIESRSLSEEIWLFQNEAEKGVFEKLDFCTISLLELPADMSRGSSSGDDTIFVLNRGNEPGKFITATGQEIEIESELLRTPLFATDFTRYEFKPKSDKVIIFPYKVQDGNAALMSQNELETAFPKGFDYLNRNRKTLEKRKQYKAWYGFSAPRNLAIHDTAQLVVPLLADKGLYAKLPAKNSQYCLMASGGFSISINPSSNLSSKYALGLLNSTLLFWYLKTISNRFRGGWITCTKQYVGKLPIRTTDFDNPTDKARHDQMVALVETMLALHQQQAAATLPQQKTMLKRQIDATDQQIDKLVYELYGLLPEEIAIVEGKE